VREKDTRFRQSEKFADFAGKRGYSFRVFAGKWAFSIDDAGENVSDAPQFVQALSRDAVSEVRSER
jgi:hypothetical protein